MIEFVTVKPNFLYNIKFALEDLLNITTHDDCKFCDEDHTCETNKARSKAKRILREMSILDFNYSVEGDE